jgi:hypothetical protein
MLGVAASGAMAVGALSSAGTAGATCASISGVGNNGQCTSSVGSFAVALGDPTTTAASANGLFDGAVANGLGDPAGTVTIANSTGNASFAYAGGPNVVAQAGTLATKAGPGGGTLNAAIAQGSNVSAFAGTANVNGTDVGNAAFNMANDPVVGVGTNSVNQVFAGGNAASPGTGNLAANLGGTSDAAALRPSLVSAFGVGNVATNLGGAGNIVESGDAFGVAPLPQTGMPANLSTAFNVLGNDNAAVSTGGPLAVSGTLFGTGKTALQNGPGFNVK